MTVHREVYVEEREKVTDTIEEKKSNYYNNGKGQECERDQKRLFQVADKLLNRGKPTALPQHDNLTTLVNIFSDFLQEKIEMIRATLSDLDSSAEPFTCP